jgi:hypothetical protein
MPRGYRALVRELAGLTGSIQSRTLAVVSAFPQIVLGALLATLLQACRAPEPGPGNPPIVAVEIPPITASASGDVEAEDGDIETEPDIARYRGKWEGRGVQDDGQSWDIVVEVFGPDEKPCAAVEYPPHDSRVSCGGEWHCDVPPSTPARLVGVERILEGRGRCIDSCQVEFDLRHGVANFDCSHAGVVGKAELRRVR